MYVIFEALIILSNRVVSILHIGQGLGAKVFVFRIMFLVLANNFLLFDTGLVPFISLSGTIASESVRNLSAIGLKACARVLRGT